jgi:hypothetical protein
MKTRKEIEKKKTQSNKKVVSIQLYSSKALRSSIFITKMFYLKLLCKAITADGSFFNLFLVW